MHIDAADLRNHYGALSDEALLAIDPGDLTAVARQCHAEELRRRRLAPRGAEDSVEGTFGAWLTPEPESVGEAAEPLPTGTEAMPGWLPEAACACAFQARPGQASAPEAARACDVLRRAGIPSHIAPHQEEPASPETPPQYEYWVMVPGALSMLATSVLDKEIINLAEEEKWRAHFQVLSDEEILALKPEILCAGLLDRVKRLKKAYEDEITRRKLR